MKSLIFFIFLVGLTPTVYAVEDVSPEMAAALVAKGAAELIDVREQSELEATGMATPALWLAKSEVDARSQLFWEFVEQTDPKKILIFYCRTGRRAESVATNFETLGFKTMNMGGFEDWVNADLPVKDFKI